jgi:hypothetical protein
MQKELKDIKTGDGSYVDGCESLVISSVDSTFIARSKVTRRQALFDKYTGNCLTNNKYRASLNKLNYVR